MRTDWVGEVFSAMRDCGEDISIIYGEKTATAAGAEPRWVELPHDRFDGIGGLATLLRERGYSVGPLPQLRDDRFSLLRALRGLLAVAPTLRLRRRKWWQFDGDREVSFLAVRDRLAWWLFTEEETQRITSAAKAARVTVNTYLLYHLDSVIASQLTIPGSRRRWMVPVNLRGAVTREVEASPHMAFFCVDLDRESTLTGIQAQISQLKQRGYHWGAWLSLNLGRLIGREAMRRDIRARESKCHGWTGIFSNLGLWEVPGSAPWIFGPAISRVHPVGAGCITLNGRMALSLQLHEAFGADLQASYSLLEDWRASCLQEPKNSSTTFQAQAYG